METNFVPFSALSCDRHDGIPKRKINDKNRYKKDSKLFKIKSFFKKNLINYQFIRNLLYLCAVASPKVYLTNCLFTVN